MKPEFYKIVIIEYYYDSDRITHPAWGTKGLPERKLFTFDEAIALIPKIRDAVGCNGFVSYVVAMIPLFKEDLKPYEEGGLL
jgi:hypothetical protein